MPHNSGPDEIQQVAHTKGQENGKETGKKIATGKGGGRDGVRKGENDKFIVYEIPKQ